MNTPIFNGPVKIRLVGRVEGGKLGYFGIDDEGDPVGQCLYFDEVDVPKFEVASNPTIRLEEIRERRVDIW